MDYFGFRTSLEESLGDLKLPSDCTLREPDWTVIHPPLSWTVEFYLDFPDKHLRIWENYDRFARLQVCRRVQWSYHYGDSTSFDEDGATRGDPNDPLDIRIDTTGGVHMHYGKREPHYQQNQIVGLDLSALTSIQFVKNVLKHRKTSRPLDAVFGFRIKA